MARNAVTIGGRASRIEGLPELLAQVNRLRVAARADTAKQVFMQGGRVLAEEMKRRAAWDHVKKAIYVSKGAPDKSYVTVGVNLGRAMDVFWLEFGTLKHDARRPKKTRLLKFQIQGRWIFVKQVANLQPKPFFRPSIPAKRAEVAAILATGFRKMIDGALAG